jgi:predicted ABC-type ATPase
MDGTGANAKGYSEQIQRLKDKGYHVTVYMPHITSEEATKRIEARAEQTGRYVNPNFVRPAYEKIPRNFEAIGKLADEAHLYDNAGPVHVGAREVLSYKDGAPIVHDKKWVADFRATYGGGEK